MQRAIYREDGAEAVVKIVEDLSDPEWEKYKLRVLVILKTAWHGASFKVGEEFEVSHRKKYPRQAGEWHLEPLPAKEM